MRINGHRKTKMGDIARAWRDLIVVERQEYVLRIATINAVSVAVDHEGVEHLRPGIERAFAVESASDANGGAVTARAGKQPGFV